MGRFRLSGRDLRSWPLAPVLLLASGLLIAGIPEDFEGFTLIRLGEAQGIDFSNGVSIVLLIAALSSLSWGGLHRSGQLRASSRKHPLALVLLSPLLIIGVVLLFISGTSTALIWWAPGTAMVVASLLGLCAVLR